MNKIGIYYAYWTQEWDADFNPYVDKVADLGFDVLRSMQVRSQECPPKRGKI